MTDTLTLGAFDDFDDSLDSLDIPNTISAPTPSTSTALTPVETAETDSLITAGQAALQTINTQGKRLIDEWVKVGKALSVSLTIKDKKERGKWTLKYFTDLAGQKYASTRKAAIWLAGLEDTVLHELKNDGRLNHPVAIKQAFDKAATEAEVDTSGTNGTNSTDSTAPAPPPAVELHTADDQAVSDTPIATPTLADAVTFPVALVETSTAPAVLVELASDSQASQDDKPSAVVVGLPVKGGFLAKYPKDGKVDPAFVTLAFSMMEEDPDAAVDHLCQLPLEELERMQATINMAMKRLAACRASSAA